MSFTNFMKTKSLFENAVPAVFKGLMLMSLAFLNPVNAVAIASNPNSDGYADSTSANTTLTDTKPTMNYNQVSDCIKSGTCNPKHMDHAMHYRPYHQALQQEFAQTGGFTSKECQSKISKYLTICQGTNAGASVCSSRAADKYPTCVNFINKSMLNKTMEEMYISYDSQEKELSLAPETEKVYGTEAQSDKTGLNIKNRSGSGFATRAGSVFPPDPKVDNLSRQIRGGAFAGVTLIDFLDGIDGRDDLTPSQKMRLRAIANANKGLFSNSLITEKVTADTSGLNDPSRADKAKNLLGFDGNSMENAAKLPPGKGGRHAMSITQKSEMERLADEARGNKLTGAANQALAAGNPAAAYDIASQAIMSNQGDSGAYTSRAMASSMMGRFDSANADASRAIELDPRNARAYYIRSRANYYKNKVDESFMDASRAITLDRESALYLRNRAGIAEAQRNYRQMLEDLQAAAKKDGRYQADFDKAFNIYAEFVPEFQNETAGPAVQRPAKTSPRPDPISETGKRLKIGLGILLLAGAGIAAAAVASRKRHEAEKTALRTMGVPVKTDTGTPPPLTAAAAARTRAAQPPSTQGGPAPLGGQFAIKRELGRGGMGVVYEAEDLTLGRRVAVKEMLGSYGNEEWRKRFLNEAKTVAALSHPNICSIYTAVAEGEKIYLVFEYVDGRPLDTLIKASGRIPPAQAKQIFLGVCDALICAHSRNIIHRDMKPSNIMVTSAGTPKVMDFGIARQADSEATMMTQSISGTPAYMAPEQMGGTLTRKSDIYALGATMYQAMTGVLPFRCAPTDPARKNYISARTHAHDISEKMDALLARALSFSPDGRFHSVEEMKAALEETR